MAHNGAVNKGSGLRVLVVDDNVDAVETLVMLLGLWGHDVRSAADGPAALQAAAAHHPDVVLLDITLPGMTGYDVARQLRADPELRDAVLVAMTGHGEAADKKAAREAGFTLHLLKPVEPDVLQKLLAGLGASRSGAG
jgi:CheY-like chemotaxis protein